MFRFKLRTLLILLAILPPIVAIISPPLVRWFVAPGFGFRINVPAMGPAPLAFDFAFPIAIQKPPPPPAPEEKPPSTDNRP